MLFIILYNFGNVLVYGSVLNLKSQFFQCRETSSYDLEATEFVRCKNKDICDKRKNPPENAVFDYRHDESVADEIDNWFVGLDLMCEEDLDNA